MLQTIQMVNVYMRVSVRVADSQHLYVSYILCGIQPVGDIYFQSIETTSMFILVKPSSAVPAQHVRMGQTQTTGPCSMHGRGDWSLFF